MNSIIVSGLGLSAFRWENNIVRLWNPTGSETGQNFAWLWKNHPPDLRKHSVMLYTKNNGNVLTKNYLLKMFDGKNQNKVLNLLHTNIFLVNFANSNSKED